jgi:hypothetical protein
MLLYLAFHVKEVNATMRLGDSKQNSGSWVWWCTSVIPALKVLGQEDQKFEACWAHSKTLSQNKCNEKRKASGLHNTVSLQVQSPV